MVDTPLVFPDIGNALASGAHARYYGQQSDLAAAEERRRSAAEPFVGAAMQGDPTAMARVAAGDPKTAVAVSTALARMDADQRAKTKEQGEYTATAANAILQADPKDRADVYHQMYGEGIRRGYKMSLPPEYSPVLDGVLRGHRATAQSINEYFKLQDGTPVPLGGGSAPAGAPMPGGGGGPYGGAIANIESSGAPNGGYGAVGPPANDKGNRAYGKYQVMDFNVGPWTQEVLGKPMTPQEFAANPQAQDVVFNAKFGQYVQKYGSPQAAARAWFAGEGGMSNPNATDVNGMSVANYERKFSAGLPAAGGQAAPGVPGPVASPVPAPPGLTLPPTAQMPGPPTGLTTPGPPPAQMPNGMPPQIAQGSGGDGSGNPQQPARPAARPIEPHEPVTDDLDRLKMSGFVQATHKGQQMKGPTGGYLYMVPGTNRTIEYKPPPNLENIRNEAEAKRKAEAGNQPPAGPFGGQSVESQLGNVLLKGDPASPEYAFAYSHFARSHTTIDDRGQPITVQPMDLSAFRKPMFNANVPPVAAPPVIDPNAPAPTSLKMPPMPAPTRPPGSPQITVGAAIPGAAKAPNNEQSLASGFADRMANSNSILSSVEEQGKSGGGRFKEAIPFGMGNFAQSKEYQSFKQARDDFINAQLRRESGSAIHADEYAKADKQYFPVPGDGPDVIKQKALNRQIVVEAMIKNAGPSYAPRAAGSAGPSIPRPAIDRLKANPAERAQFDEIFGAGAAAKVLGQ